jgi:hypothetical protein
VSRMTTLKRVITSQKVADGLTHSFDNDALDSIAIRSNLESLAWLEGREEPGYRSGSNR